MSADMMVICQEDNSGYDGDSELAFFIDETSLGEPCNEFGKWFQSRFCGEPGLLDKMAGIREHDYSLLTESDIVGIEHALQTMICHERLNKVALCNYLKKHIGKHISTENW